MRSSGKGWGHLAMNSEPLNLEDCLDALIDYRGKTPEKTASGIPLITAKIVKSGRIEKPTEFIAEANYESWMRRGIPKAGDVVLTVEAPLGEVAQLGTGKIALAQRIVTLRGKTGVLDNTYLLYLLQTEDLQSQLRARATGTTVVGIKQSELRKIQLRLPAMGEQRQAAAMLKALDDRITLVRETNETLEAIAHALFKSWFVDFDPVKAKMQGRRPHGMDEATSAIFPGRLEASELGEVPSGWSLVSLKDAVSIFDSRRIPLSSAERAQRRGVYPYYGAASAMDTIDDFIFDGIHLLIGEDGSVTTPNGKPVLQYVWGKFWVNNHAHVLQGKGPVSTEHLLLALKQEDIRAFVTGAVQPKLSQANMWRIRFLMPTGPVASAFNNLIAPLFAKIRSNSERMASFIELRDTLLPRLISGQLRIREADTEAAQVA